MIGQMCRLMIGLLILISGWSQAANISLAGMSAKGELARITINDEINAADVARFKDIVGLLKSAKGLCTRVR